MAQRRMFSKKITETDLFLDMPMSAQCLYFHLNMSADDDGFIGNAKTIRRMIGASEDDLKLLLSKEFLIPFQSGVVVVKDWRIHNYIRSDRYSETVYQDEKKSLQVLDNGRYEFSLENVIPNDIPDDNQTGYQMDTQVRLGKDRVVKDKKDNSPKSKKRIYDVESIHYQLAEYLFEKMKENNPEVKEPKLNDWANDIRLMMEIDNRKEEQVRNMITWSQSNDFWKGNILSAKKLRDKYDQMKVQANQPYKNNNAAAPKNDSVKYDIKQSEFFTMPEGYSFDD